MIWALLLVIFMIIVVVAISGQGRVAWANKLRRLHAGSAYKGEWMAPDTIVNQVTADYLAAIHWLHNSTLSERSRQWAMAPAYLDGAFLKRYQRVLLHYQSAGIPPALGVLRADHQVMVRHFSEDGERCLVIDNQTERRMATYDTQTRERLHTQDLGDVSLVYQMAYDAGSDRWKIESYLQELPAGWKNLQVSQRIRVLSSLPASAGRDN